MFPVRNMHLRLSSCKVQRQLPAKNTNPHGPIGLKRPRFKQRHIMALRSLLHMHRPLPTRCRSRSVIRVFRNLAAEKGCIPQVFKDQAPSLLESGYAYKIPELRIKKRESQGLPPLPKGNPENVRKTLKGVKFIEKIQKPAGEKPSGQ